MKSAACLALSLLAMGRGYAENGEAKITNRQVSVAGFVDAGQVVHGSFANDDGTTPAADADRLFLNRNGVAVAYSGTLNEKLHMNIGVGGLFWKPVAIPENPSSQHIQFGPGISEASAQYDFSRNLNLKFGYFGYDANPDAKNLGDYLLRSEAYPGIIHTAGPGGWVWINESKYKSMGTKLTWNTLDGALRHDFMIFSEFWDAPVFDFSPSYVTTWKVGKGLEIGGGISLRRWLPINSDATTPKGAGNSNVYAEVDNFPAFPALNDAVNHQLPFSGGTLKDMENHISSYVDSSGAAIATLSYDGQGNTIFVLANGDTLRPKKEATLTFKAIVVMGRASLDLGDLLGLNRAGPFKLFGEVAVLGVENQPYYYEDVLQRIPIMMGADIPTFGVLNLLCLQLEYFNNPYPDNNYTQFNNSLPQPAFPSNNPALYEAHKQSGEYRKDNFKWTVFLQKTLIPGLDLFAQAANDHFRVQDFNAQPSTMPVTREKADWYYLLRLQWSM